MRNVADHHTSMDRANQEGIWLEYKAVEVALMSSPVEAKTSSSFDPEKGSGDTSSTVMCRTLPGAG